MIIIRTRKSIFRMDHIYINIYIFKRDKLERVECAQNYCVCSDVQCTVCMLRVCLSTVPHRVYNVIHCIQYILYVLYMDGWMFTVYCVCCLFAVYAGCVCSMHVCMHVCLMHRPFGSSKCKNIERRWWMMNEFLCSRRMNEYLVGIHEIF